MDILVPALVCLPFGLAAAVLARADLARSEPPVGWLGLVASGGFALIWSLETTTRFSAFPAGGIFPLALDATMFSGLIAELGDWRMVGRMSSSLADVPTDLYHFASFGFAALAVRLGLEPMQAMPRVWVALGPLFISVGLHLLGRTLAGPAAGIVAVLLLVVLPEPASYGLAQPFLSFHWMSEVSPGAAYAIGAICVSFSLLALWCRERGYRLLAASAAMMALGFLLRAHLVLWAAAPWAAVAVAGWPGLRPLLRAVLLLLGALVLAGGLVFAGRAEVAQVGFGQYAGGFLLLVGTVFVPNGYMGVSTWLVAHLGLGGSALPLALIALGAMGGAPLLTFLMGAVLLRRRLSAIDVLPFALLAWAAALMILAPTPFHGDSSEFRQRGFLLVVVILIAWNARWVLLGLPALAARGAALGLAACAGLLVTWLCVADWKAPRTAYFQQFRATPVSAAMVEGGAWLRAHAVPGGSFVVDRQNLETIAADDGTLLSAFSGLPAWISRAALHLKREGAAATEARHRLDVLAEMAAAPDAAAAMSLLCREGVSFYVVTGDAPSWDPERRAAAFRAEGLSIWPTGTDRPCARPRG
ncbi:MAG: hypothetical protein JWR00_3286 [Rubritepida sp.]|nr:hypothetical protein [Rubritepida sp.]